MTTPLRQSSSECPLVRQLRLCCLGLALLLPIAAPAWAQQPPASPGPLRPGDIVVVTHEYNGGGRGGTLVKIDASSGAETTLSDFADPSQGPIATPHMAPPPHFFVNTLLVEGAASILVWHSLFGGALLQVDLRQASGRSSARVPCRLLNPRETFWR